MNICKECKRASSDDIRYCQTWTCSWPEALLPERWPVTGLTRVGVERIPLCVDVNKDGTCAGFERRETPHV